MVRHGKELVMGCKILELGDKVLEKDGRELVLGDKEQVLDDKEQELGEACPPCHHDCRWSHLWRPVHGSLTWQSTGRGQTQGKETEIKII